MEAEGGARSSRNRSSLVLHAELIRLISLKLRRPRSVLLRLFQLPGAGFIGGGKWWIWRAEEHSLSGEDQHHLPHQPGAQLEQNFTFFKHTKNYPAMNPAVINGLIIAESKLRDWLMSDKHLRTTSRSSFAFFSFSVSIITISN